jgi:hypothetical protein
LLLLYRERENRKCNLTVNGEPGSLSNSPAIVVSSKYWAKSPLHIAQWVLVDVENDDATACHYWFATLDSHTATAIRMTNVLAGRPAVASRNHVLLRGRDRIHQRHVLRNSTCSRAGRRDRRARADDSAGDGVCLEEATRLSSIMRYAV